MATSEKYGTCNSENNTKVQQNRFLEDGSGTDELLLPPPSCWFNDDLEAAAPSSSSCSSEDDQQECYEDEINVNTDTIGEEQVVNSSCIPNLPIDQSNGHSSSHSYHSFIETTNNSLLSPPFVHRKTPPLASFRENPALTPPRVVAAPSPSWKEISSQVLPSAAKELLSASLQRICYTARLSYAKGRWHREYSDLGNNSGGYFQQPYLTGNSSIEKIQQQQHDSSSHKLFPDLPPFSSLSWVDRQMVREWRTYLPEDKSGNGHMSSGQEIDSKQTHPHQSGNTDAIIDDQNEQEDIDFDRARTLVPQPVRRPRWQKGEICYECRKPFGPTRLRHHCRLCGYSFCQSHSGSVHRLPHLGYNSDVPERVCDPCKRGLLAQNLAERVAWRLTRIRDLECEQLTPYFETGIDTVEEATLRIAHAVLATARSIPLGAQATVAVETVEVLRRHGLNGIYGIMLRKEFLAAADLLRKALGINKTAWPLSVHELSAAIFYALAQHRAMRGINPDREEIIHAFVEGDGSEMHIHDASDKADQEIKGRPQLQNEIVIDDTDEYNPDIEHLVPIVDSTSRPTGAPQSTLLNTQGGMDTMICSSCLGLPFKPVCNPVADQVLNSLIFYAPIALTFIYATKEVDMQLLAAQQGWKLLYAYLNPDKDRDGGMVTDMPASAAFVHEQHKIVCLAIRGTATIHDVVTDVRQMPVSFPEMASSSSSGTPPEGWTSVSRGKGLAVCGMATAAMNLFQEHCDVLMHLARQGYRIRITGHSLGGGVATLVGVLLLKELEQAVHCENLAPFTLKELLRVYTYGPPSSVDADLAKFTESFVTTAVLHDDVVPRLTPTSCRGLLKHLLHIRETWVKAHLSNDLMALGERASMAWAPRWRSGFTLTRSSKLSLKRSSRSIKRFCQKQLQNGTKQLWSVPAFRDAMVVATGGEQQCAESFPVEEKKQEISLEERNCTIAKPEDSITTTPLKVDSIAQEKEEMKAAKQERSESVAEPKLLVELMGGMDNRADAVVIDGDEFFAADEILIESEEDSLATTEMFVDAFDEAKRYDFLVCDGHLRRFFCLLMFVQSHEHGATSIAENAGVSRTAYQSSAQTSDVATKAMKEEHYTQQNESSSEDDDEGPGAVVLEEIPLPRMFIPGKIVHIYSHRGVYKAAYVPRAFRDLRRISLAGNMLSDHTTTSYYESLLEVRSVRNAEELPPRWTAFHEDDTCSCCASRFTWASTSDSEAQEARDKHNCRSCGTLVCNPCSTNRIALPSIGITVPVRVCDRCYNDLGGLLTSPLAMTNSFVEENRRLNDNADPTTRTGSEHRKVERQRERRSLVVDDLARRMKESALTSA